LTWFSEKARQAARKNALQRDFLLTKVTENATVTQRSPFRICGKFLDENHAGQRPVRWRRQTSGEWLLACRKLPHNKFKVDFRFGSIAPVQV
jgi:hypothetical protein